MITLTALNNFLSEYLLFDKNLDVAKIDVQMSNGLMVKGKEEIRKIGFGVSASLALFEKAKEHSYDAIIVHHTFNFPPANYYDGIFQKRIAFLLKNEISLFGYHFLLDAHPEIGNNARIIKTMGAEIKEPYLTHGFPWGYLGELKKEKTFGEIKDIFSPYFSERAKTYDFGPEKIKKIVACSGKGAPYPSEMQKLIEGKVDLFITGEVHEWNRELFREAAINFIAGGHYATEVFGIKALMEKVNQKFPDIDAEWIDLSNDV